VAHPKESGFGEVTREGIESATFLTPEQKRDIFYNKIKACRRQTAANSAAKQFGPRRLVREKN
jgi:hypothetical protein